ncbi:MAG: hypothetical protein GAK40_01515 [Burkholderia plantarii]|nr:MAG: hypothetical protein GAK40_01515 [Burkholderia plantarii]
MTEFMHLPRRLARLAGAALLGCAALAAHAQGAPQSVAWEIRVMRDGQSVDTFHQTTAVGQSRTDTHTYPVTVPADCTGEIASAVAATHPQRTRTVTVAPLDVQAGTISLAIDVQDTFDDAGHCTLSPRQVSASHPGLGVHADTWTDWTLVDSSPHLVYQVRAHVSGN